MKQITSYGFNMDTACVELIFSDGGMIAIDTIGVENAVADNMYQRSELDWLIYNKSLGYVRIVLEGNLEEYLRGKPKHRLWAAVHPHTRGADFIWRYLWHLSIWFL